MRHLVAEAQAELPFHMPLQQLPCYLCTFQIFLHMRCVSEAVDIVHVCWAAAHQMRWFSASMSLSQVIRAP